MLIACLTLFCVGQETAPRFVDVTEACGLTPGNGPAAWGDVDGDGRSDLLAGGALWRNTEEGFERAASVPAGLLFDADGDGDLDVFGLADQSLHLQEAAWSFRAVEHVADVPTTTTLGAAAGDFDGDGRADVYVGGYENWGDQTTFPDLWLRNTEEGLTLARSEVRYRARGVSACDFDEDGDLDVYVSNYRLQPNLLWRNDGAGVFEDVAGALGAVATSEGFGGGHSIGAAWGDFDGDGRFDLFAGNFAHVDARGDQPKSRFLLGRADAAFEDRGTCGVFYQESYASPAAADYDGDGDLDLFFTTVYETASFGRKNNAALFRNDGDLRFVDATAEAGLAGLPATYQAAWADYDNDGDLDLLTAGRLYENRGSVARWLELRLDGAGRSVLGAQVRVVAGEREFVRQVEAGTGQGSQNDLRLHFGLGGCDPPVRLHVLWPGGARRTLSLTELDRVHVLRRAP